MVSMSRPCGVGVGPGVGEGPEAGAGVADGGQGVEGVAGGAGQPVQACHQHGVAGLQALQRAAVGAGAVAFPQPAASRAASWTPRSWSCALTRA